jgi:hypothetical protein
VAWIALAACVAPGGGDPNLLGCLVDAEEAVTDPDARPPGFSLSPAEARDRALGPTEGGLDRHDGARIGLDLQIEAAGAMTLQRRSWQASGGHGRPEPAAQLDCEDAYAVPVSVRLQALPDLDVVGTTTLTVTAGGRSAFDLRIDAAAHAGSAAPRAGDVDDDVTAIDLWLGGGREAGPWVGEVGFGIERRHGEGPDGTVSYAFHPYGGWTAASHPE